MWGDESAMSFERSIYRTEETLSSGAWRDGYSVSEKKWIWDTDQTLYDSDYCWNIEIFSYAKITTALNFA